VETAFYETSAPRVYLVRDEGDRPERRSALLGKLRNASRGGPIAVVLEVGTAPGMDPSAAGFWMAAIQDREADVAVVAVVTRAAAVRLATLAFGAIATLRHLPVEVRAHGAAAAPHTWAAEALARAAAARRLAGAVRT
jgi:hypothetical protein